MTRQDKINSILNTIKNNVEYPGIPVHLWLAEPGDEDFEEWMRICTQWVDSYYIETKKRDTDSQFARFVAEYGRREY